MSIVTIHLLSPLADKVDGRRTLKALQDDNLKLTHSYLDAGPISIESS